LNIPVIPCVFVHYVCQETLTYRSDQVWQHISSPVQLENSGTKLLSIELQDSKTEDNIPNNCYSQCVASLQQHFRLSTIAEICSEEQRIPRVTWGYTFKLASFDAVNSKPQWET